MDGFECAGHPGMDDVGSFLLLAIACKKLNVPFIASGGIGTGIQLAAALALGAEGINMGTRFMATVEAPIHVNIKKALVDSDQTCTTLILRYYAFALYLYITIAFRTLKNTERVFKNEQARLAQEAEAAKPGDISVIREFIAGSKYRISFQETGNINDSVWSCGQIMGLIEDIPTCQQLVDDIMVEAEKTISTRLNSMIASRI